jgi:hypothetical protein
MQAAKAAQKRKTQNARRKTQDMTRLLRHVSAAPEGVRRRRQQRKSGAVAVERER